jgi:hypothetical protein
VQADPEIVEADDRTIRARDAEDCYDLAGSTNERAA